MASAPPPTFASGVLLDEAEGRELLAAVEAAEAGIKVAEPRTKKSRSESPSSRSVSIPTEPRPRSASAGPVASERPRASRRARRVARSATAAPAPGASLAHRGRQQLGGGGVVDLAGVGQEGTGDDLILEVDLDLSSLGH